MTRTVPTGRVHGRAYRRTQHMKFPELADHMYSLLTLTPASRTVPAGTKFALHHNGTQTVVLKVLNLTDEFLFERQTWTCQAQALHDSMEAFFEAFNWSNPNDGLDRRFFYTIHLLSEHEQHEREHAPGLFLHPADS